MSLQLRAAALTRAVGQSGRRYLVEKLLQDRPGNDGRVYLATSEKKSYVLKSVPSDDFEYTKSMLEDVRGSPYVRVHTDVIPEHSMFAYNYLRSDFLSFLAQKAIPLTTTKRILRDALRGIAALHSKNIVHTDIKPNNILLNWNETEDGVEIEQVQIADVDDAARVPEGSAIQGMPFGNWMWRSPEAHMSGPAKKPTDIFSFGAVCICAMTKDIICSLKLDQLHEDASLESLVVERQISLFADYEGVCGLIDYYKGTPWADYIVKVVNNFSDKNPRRPFDTRQDLDPEFKDLVVRMMNVDPRRRLTAEEALAHTWFAEGL